MAAFCDHQDDFAATPDHPGMAWLGMHDEAVDVGWKIVYGHSAHVFQGVGLVEGCAILYAAGDLVDDYAVDPGFRNDHQLLFELEPGTGAGIEGDRMVIASRMEKPHE